MAGISLAPAVLDVSGIRAGDRNMFQLTIRTSGTALNLTGYEITAQARTTASAPAHLDAVVTITNETGGVCLVRWPGEAVRTWLGGQNSVNGVWDLQLLDAEGNDPWTVLTGSFKAEMDVTHE
jgi:hypothetical protein